jgi:hypothetical protein
VYLLFADATDAGITNTGTNDARLVMLLLQGSLLRF